MPKKFELSTEELFTILPNFVSMSKRDYDLYKTARYQDEDVKLDKYLSFLEFRPKHVPVEAICIILWGNERIIDALNFMYRTLSRADYDELCNMLNIPPFLRNEVWNQNGGVGTDFISISLPLLRLAVASNHMKGNSYNG